MLATAELVGPVAFVVAVAVLAPVAASTYHHFAARAAALQSPTWLNPSMVACSVIIVLVAGTTS
jgi:hypothetical protein